LKFPLNKESHVSDKNKNMFKEELEGESEIIHDMGKGVIAGFVATAALALLLLVQGALGLLPQFDVIGMLTMIAGSSWPGMGWLIFFGCGGIALGVIFALLDARVEATTGAGELVRGGLFGILLWLALMLVLMPIYGAGAFGLAYGIGAPILTLVADIIYGLVLGAVYGAMHPETVMT
jgi:hypothetical protein